MAIITLRITGTSPLLMQADTLVDPLDPITKAHKEITSKRKKTDDDYEAIAISEMRSYLYFNEGIGIHIPAVNIEACLRDAAKLNRLGQHVKRGIVVIDDAKLDYKGPRDPDELVRTRAFQYAKTVVVQRARLMRYRPIFNQWACEFSIAYDDTILNKDEVLAIAENAGKFSGIGTYRPRFGRFSVEVVEDLT